jgi:hypothetical protein
MEDIRILDFFNVLKGHEVDIATLDFEFIGEFVPQRAIFTGISFKEGFPGTLNGDFLIEGHIKGFPEFPVKTFRRKNFFKNGVNTFPFLELKDIVENIFEASDLYDLEENGIVDIDKNIVIIEKLNPLKNLDKIKAKNKEELIEKFLKETEKLIQLKCEQKVLRYLENLKREINPVEIDLPDELKGIVSPKGMLIEPSPPYSSKKIKPALDVKIRGLNTIPSVNAVAKKIKENKKLNSIESYIEEKFNRYSSENLNLAVMLKDVNNDLLKTVYERENIRQAIFANLDDKEVELEKEFNIGNKTVKTKVKIFKEDTGQEVKKNVSVKNEIDI